MEDAFCSVTNAPADVASQFLRHFNGDINRAVVAFFDDPSPDWLRKDVSEEDPNPTGPPVVLRKKSSKERASDAPPIWTGEAKDDGISCLIRCGKSRLNVKLPKEMTGGEFLQYTSSLLSPHGLAFEIRIRKGGKKISFEHNGVNASNNSLLKQTLASMGLAPRMMAMVTTPGDVKPTLKGARLPKPTSSRTSAPHSSSSGPAILHPTSLAELKSTINSSRLPVVVDFFATWCGPCRRIAPTFEGLAKEHAGKVVFVKVDADKSPDILRAMGVSSFPTFQFYNGGTKIDEMVGADTNGLRQRVGTIAGLIAAPASTPMSTATPTPNARMESRGGPPRRGFSGMFGASPGDGAGTPPSSADAPPARSSGGGRRVHTFGSLRGRSAAPKNTDGKNVFSATDLGFGGRGG